MGRRPGVPKPFWEGLAVSVIKPVVRAAMKRSWRGQEHMPKSGGVIIAANHVSEVDHFALAVFVYNSGRWPVFLAKSGIFDVKGVGWAMRSLNQVPVYRATTDAAKSLGEATAALEKGAAIIIYPEGTCTRDPDLWPMVAKTGVARLALSTGCPVIPVANWGAHKILAYKERRPHLLPKKTAEILAGPPVDLSEYSDESPKTLRAATTKIMREIADLLGEIRGEKAPEELYNPRRDVK